MLGWAWSVLKVCTGYRMNGHLQDTLPANAEEVTQVEPVYTVLPGWEDESVRGVEHYDDLPYAARHYIEFIEFWAGVPVQLVSLGPDRVDTIERHDPFG